METTVKPSEGYDNDGRLYIAIFQLLDIIFRDQTAPPHQESDGCIKVSKVERVLSQP